MSDGGVLKTRYGDLLSALKKVESNGANCDKVIARAAGGLLVGPAMQTAGAVVVDEGRGKRGTAKSSLLEDPVSRLSVTSRLSALTAETCPDAHVVPTDAVQMEQMTKALVEEIVQSSKLLNKVSHLPPHLQTFKLDFERFQAKKVRLPTLHQQLTPRTKKRISQLDPPSVEEALAVEKYVSMAKATSGSKAYENLGKVVTESRVKSQRTGMLEDHLVRAAKEAELRSNFERILMPLPVLADLGLSQDQLTSHGSTSFFTKLVERRKQDEIKASITARFAPGSEDNDADGQSLFDASSSVYEGIPSSIGNYSVESHLSSFLNDALSKRADSRSSSPNSSAPKGMGSATEGDVNSELYGSIAVTNERGQPVYDNRGNLHPRTLAESYSEVFQETRGVYSEISTRYSALQLAVRTARSQDVSFKKAEKSLMDEVKMRSYDDLGLDLDAKFTAVRVASRAVNMMMFYMIEVRLRGSFVKLKEQTRLASIARREAAAALINRVARGMFARLETRQLRRMLFLAREVERRTAETRQTTLRKAVQCITRAIRLYGKMRVLRINRRRRLAATCVQRHIRGKLAKIRCNRLRNWNEWLKFNAVRIQCAFRQHLARRKVCVRRKIGVVKSWELEAARLKAAKDDRLRKTGAVSFIMHCYRAYKIRYKLKIIIHWHRVELAVVLQKWVRGYFDRKMVKRIKKRKFDRERVIREAAIAIQKIVRGRQVRRGVYKQLLGERVKELLAKRRAKAKYLKDAGKNNVMRVIYGTLRTFVPFRYIILRQNAVMIQRFYRGHRARKRVFLMKIRAAINAQNRKYFGGYNGAVQFQRVFRGYRYRRDKIKAKRRLAALVIQCAFRCSQARWAVIQKKVRRDALMMIGKNIVTMMKFKKAQWVRRENRKYKHVVIKIQRFLRGALGRWRFHNIKTDRRSHLERSKVNDLRLNQVLASVQLRIVMESIETPIGEKPESLCGLECYARGPIQAVFCAAVGKKARLEAAAMPTNKLDSGTFSKFAARVKGMMENGRPEKEGFDDLWKPPKIENDDETTISKPPGGGSPSRLTQGKGKARPGPGPGRGKRQKSEKIKVRLNPPGQFALIDALRSEGLSVVTAVKPLSKLDFEMFFAKARQEGQKELRYFEFIECVGAAANAHYGVVQEDDLSASSKEGLNRLLVQASNVAEDSVGSVMVDGFGNEDDDEALGAEDENSEVSDVTERAMKERRHEARLKKRIVAGKSSKVKVTVGDGKLLWPLKEITSKSRANYKVLLLLKMMDSLRSNEWWLDVADWMEQEARVRVGVYVKRIQNLYWHMKSAAFRALMRDRIGAKQRMEEYNKTIVIIQAWVRRFTGKSRAQHAAQVFLVKYIPDVGEPYWFNPSTRVTSKTKPLILGPYECLSIALPPPGLEFVVQCSNCTVAAVINCWECEDSYCRKCYDNLHCKGKRRLHHYFPIPKCGYCKFQVASKCCITCITIKPEPGSAQEQMKESDRGTLCDCCFTHLHDESERFFDESQAEKKLQLRQIFARSREAYLIKQQLKQGIVTDHKFDFLVQECEECNIRAASWRCGDCKQIYCNVCLVGLHSLGGPFASHRAEKLPFYTREMHQSFLMDQRTQIFQHKMETVKRAWEQRAEAHRYKSIVRIQAWWRMHFHGLRRGSLVILKGRKKERRAWRLRRAEMPIRQSLKYKALDLLGMAPPLFSDTREEQVLKRITVFGKQFAREYIWKNKSSFGFYERGANAGWQKGDPMKGFDVGEIEELKQQARKGGYRMPGVVYLKKGETKHATSHDLSKLVQNGMLVRVGGSYFMVRRASENSILLDRIWRWESVSEGVICYRLPAYSDEPRRHQFKAIYYLSNFAISNPLSQFYFSQHFRLFDNLKGVAEYVERIHKNYGFRRGSMEWRRYAQKLERRAKWAQDLLDDVQEVVDLSKQKSVKEKKPGAEGGGGAVAAALQEAAEAGEFKLPEDDSDEENADDKPKERAPGERYYATEEELKERLKAEAAMSLEELIATRDDWIERIDPMSENIFWTHKNTCEMVGDMPAALKAAIAKETKEAEDRKNAQDALAKLNSAKGLNAHGKKKTAVGMSGKR